MSAGNHALNLLSLASESVADYRILRFEGREAMSEPFEYRVELIGSSSPPDIKQWIGKLLEFSVGGDGEGARLFAGRIYETHVAMGAGDLVRLIVVARPAYYALRYARGTHFMQDRDAIEVFNKLTADVAGQVADVSAATPPKKPYVVRYDESEMDFLDRLLAQEGIMYFFVYDKSAGPFRHRMIVASQASAYRDVAGEADRAFEGGHASSRLTAFTAAYRAAAGSHRYHGFDVNKLDAPFAANTTLGTSWGSVHSHQHEELVGTAEAAGDVQARAKVHADAVEQEQQMMSGGSDDPFLFAGGKIKTDWGKDAGPARLVLTTVTHTAYDPSALSQSGGPATYSNSFTGIDAAMAFRPPAPSSRRRAYGPVLGLVKDAGSADGQVVIDTKSRIPVEVEQVMKGDPAKPFDPFVWLPVQQQWAHATHGAQFFPRIGTRVIVDFLYGDPDLPFVAGTIYTPSAKYPFDPASKATQTGWQSKTDKNGSITQQFLFEDKPGSEEIYLYTGRDYRRQVDHDEMGTIKNDRTITVEHDHSETVNNNQTIKVDRNQDETIGLDQTITVQQNRTMKVTGKQDTTIDQTRTVTVTGKSLLESKEEIDLKVGPSSIKLTLQGIEIKAPMITIKAETTLDMSGGAQAQLKAPLVQVNADATLILKGGMVLIN